MQRRHTALTEETPLKQKLQDHYVRKDFTVSKAKIGISGLFFTVGMTLSLAFEGHFITVPAYFGGYDPSSWTSWFFLAQLGVSFLFIQAAGNWYLAFDNRADKVTKEMRSLYYPNMLDTPPGWRVCVTCQLDAPPRSHHCPLCNTCILKRDQHCFFTGSCVGYHNQRNFIVFLFYISIAAGSAAFFQISYLHTQIPLFTDAGIFYIPMVAVGQMLTGVAHPLNVFMLIHLYMTIFAFGCPLFFLGWDLLAISNGQTLHEAWKGKVVYRKRSAFSNFYSVFGSPFNALICFLIPIRMPSPGDGIKWDIETKADKGN